MGLRLTTQDSETHRETAVPLLRVKRFGLPVPCRREEESANFPQPESQALNWWAFQKCRSESNRVHDATPLKANMESGN